MHLKKKQQIAERSQENIFIHENQSNYPQTPTKPLIDKKMKSKILSTPDNSTKSLSSPLSEKKIKIIEPKQPKSKTKTKTPKKVDLQNQFTTQFDLQMSNQIKIQDSTIQPLPQMTKIEENQDSNPNLNENSISNSNSNSNLDSNVNIPSKSNLKSKNTNSKSTPKKSQTTSEKNQGFFFEKKEDFH